MYIYFEILNIFLAAEGAPGIAPSPRSRRVDDPPGALGPRAAQSGRSSPSPPARRGDPPSTSNGYMGMGQNPGTPVVHIKIAGIYGCE